MIRFLIEKEFKQIIRHSFLPKLIFAFPVLMLVVMPWAANQEVKNIRLSVVDSDHSTESQRMLHKIIASGYFMLTDISTSHPQAMQSIEAGEADIILEIPNGFARDMAKTDFTDVLISANAVNGMKAGLGSSYLASILTDYAKELSIEKGGSVSSFQPAVKFLFNPHLDYKVFMLPALMVMLLTMLCGFLPALNIVGEKESGTIEQLNVTPIKKLTFILAKLLPYWVIGFIVLTISFGIAALLYHLFPGGSAATWQVASLLTIYLYAGIYLLVVSGLGLLISNYSATMQQAMFVMFFFVMILILMCGLFTPISSMPDWAQAITAINPLTYFMQVMRAVYLKGSSMSELLPQLFALLSFAIVFNVGAVLSYRKTN
ncbi:ABC transporter permease [Bacteroidia bacterium]|nr:ABC transporter permease [Bacteroidia bacterium]